MSDTGIGLPPLISMSSLSDKNGLNAALSASGDYRPALSNSCRWVLARAAVEARRLKHRYVGPEHLLLALTRQRRSRARQLLSLLAVDVRQVGEQLDTLVARGKDTGAIVGNLPFTSRVKGALKNASCEAQRANSKCICTAHLLLGLAMQENGIAAHALRGSGVTVERVRAALEHEAAASAAAFRIVVDETGGSLIYEQIVAQVREAIATKTLQTGDRLPTVRRLADQLDVAPGTVARAYSELERLGLVVTEGARGTRVASREQREAPEPSRTLALARLLRPVVVTAFHLGASAQDLHEGLKEAMKDIFRDSDEQPPAVS